MVQVKDEPCAPLGERPPLLGVPEFTAELDADPHGVGCDGHFKNGKVIAWLKDDALGCGQIHLAICEPSVVAEQSERFVRPSSIHPSANTEPQVHT
jgi:hypothetical protein